MKNLHHTVLGENRIARGTRDQAHGRGGEIHAQGFGESTLRIRQHGNACICSACCLAPCFHHEGVIDRDADNLIHAFGIEITLGADKARDMRGMAGRREGAWNGEDHNLAAFEGAGQINLLGAIGAHTDQGCIGQCVAD